MRALCRDPAKPLASCRLQAIPLYDSLVDAPQRIDSHPAFEVHLLTPHLWKQHFANNLLRSQSLPSITPQRRFHLCSFTAPLRLNLTSAVLSDLVLHV